MTDFLFVNLIYNFLVNEIFGNLLIFVAFIVGIMLIMLYISRIPRLAMALYVLAMVFTFSNNDYIIPQWVTILAFAAVGCIWVIILIMLARGAN